MEEVFNYHESLSAAQRKTQGAFFTPERWVDKIYEYADAMLGRKWRERAYVWDPACGAGALTYGRGLAHVFSSGIEEDELNIVRSTQPGASVFNFDFLNQQLDELPDALKQRLDSGRGQFLVIVNPPYGKPPANTAVAKEYADLGGAVKQEMSRLFLSRIADIASDFAGEFHIIAVTKNFYGSERMIPFITHMHERLSTCLLYTSDAADDIALV